MSDPTNLDDLVDLVAFGRRCASSRERLGWSQETVAKLVGVDVGTVGRWEAGKRAPQMPQLARLAHVLAEPLAYLVLGPGASDERKSVTVPPAFLKFLATRLGEEAQQRAYIDALLSIRLKREPTVALYESLTALLLANDSQGK